MNRFKNFSVVLFAVVLAGAVISCDKDKGADPLKEGRKAGTEMCACVDAIPVPTNPEEFGDYAQKLGMCPAGVLAAYQEYVTFVYTNYDPEAEDPLYSVFDFKNSKFEQGFKEATNGCMQAFELLFSMMGQ